MKRQPVTTQRSTDSEQDLLWNEIVGVRLGWQTNAANDDNVGTVMKRFQTETT